MLNQNIQAPVLRILRLYKYYVIVNYNIIAFMNCDRILNSNYRISDAYSGMML